jgi:hypothetical protein
VGINPTSVVCVSATVARYEEADRQRDRQTGRPSVTDSSLLMFEGCGWFERVIANRN